MKQEVITIESLTEIIENKDIIIEQKDKAIKELQQRMIAHLRLQRYLQTMGLNSHMNCWRNI